MRVNDELSIALPEAASTGFIWTIDAPEVIDLLSEEGREIQGGKRSEAALALVADEFVRNGDPNGGMRVGGGGTRHLTFRTLRVGACSLRLVKRRPWQHPAQATEEFEVHLNVAAKPTGASDFGLFEPQKGLFATAA